MTERIPSSATLEFEDDQLGFTLVEVLVTLCVVSLLGGLIVGSFSHLGRMNSITRSVAAEQELETSLDYIRALLMESRDLPLLTQTEAKMSLVGSEKTLRLITLARTGSQQKVLRDVELTIGEVDGSVALIERHRARRAMSDTLEGEFPVVTGLQSLKFTYLVRSDAGVFVWQDRWAAAGRPYAISIEVTYSRGGRIFSGERRAFLVSGR